jgi:hypothetical protein
MLLAPCGVNSNINIQIPDVNLLGFDMHKLYFTVESEALSVARTSHVTI